LIKLPELWVLEDKLNVKIGSFSAVALPCSYIAKKLLVSEFLAGSGFGLKGHGQQDRESEGIE
jgi:hypothetical protein